MEDEILAEVSRIREEYAAEFNYDLQAIFLDLKQLEAECGEPRVSRGPRYVDTVPFR